MELGLYPGNVMCPDPEMEGRRVMGVVEVLRRLPGEAITKLTDEQQDLLFEWFIPGDGRWGICQPFVGIIHPNARRGRERLPPLVPYARVIYQSPLLEAKSWDLMVLVVAHELAHVVLDHPLFGCDPATYAKNEQAVFDLVCAWGFEKEAKKHRAIRKALATREERQTRALVAKLKKKKR
jgi:hypothetical protein